MAVQKSKAKIKRKPKGQRIHARRVKQMARKNLTAGS